MSAFLEGRDGSIWIGSYQGLNRLKDGRITLATTQEGLSNNHVLSLWEDESGTLWIGTESGLSRRERGRIQPFSPMEAMSRVAVHAIIGNGRGALWIGTSNGLFRLQAGTTRTFFKSDGLSSNVIGALYEDRDGTLWIGTSGGGICRYQQGVFKAITTADGLPDDTISQIIEDDRGYLWLGSNKGILRVNKKELDDFASGGMRSFSLMVYGTIDGMKSGECNGGSQPSAWRCRDGRLLFATVKGMVTIDPADLRLNPLPPPVHIERVVIDRQIRAAAAAVRVPPGRGELEFHYAGLSFLQPSKVRFKYRLEGYDNDWTDAGARRVAYYTNIPPGQYRFRVIASNNDGIWNQEGAAFAFYLAPHFYQTYPFYMLCAVLLLLAGVGVYGLRVRQLKAAKRKLELLVAQRTSELETANQKLEQLAILDGLTGIANHRRGMEFLDRQWKQMARQEMPVSLVLLDIDHFKSYNDTLGHLAGDDCLRKVAAALSSGVRRAGDLVCRYGGEEFLVILAAMDSAAAARVAETLRIEVEALAIPHPASATSARVTISLGVATALALPNTKPDCLLAAADKALYRAKGEGRNCVRVG